ncbi:prosaposin [Engraulis encrasicolus]|uniref:prosaposin n=1 Tax=Engraulis encrasicolus TaxID=184585 RepID=UPI002FD6C60C
MSTFLKLLLLICLHNAGGIVAAEDLDTVPEELPAVTIDTCKTCSEIIDLVKDLLSDTRVQGMITHDLDLVCEKLGSPVPVKACKDAVEKNLPVAFTLFSNVVDAGKVCDWLGLCAVEGDHRLQQVMTKLLTALESSDLQVGFSLQCKFCVYLLQFLENILPVEKTETAVAHALERVCGLLPSAYRQQCEDFIEAYSKKLIEMLLDKSSPQTICTLLLICRGMEEAPAIGSHMSGYACAVTSYKCRNLLTAIECGAVEFCQRRVWM